METRDSLCVNSAWRMRKFVRLNLSCPECGDALTTEDTEDTENHRDSVSLCALCVLCGSIERACQLISTAREAH